MPRTKADPALAPARARKTPESRLWVHDRGLGLPFICGVDEAGRGPLAGGVVAACVILDLNGTPISGLNDSKRLGEARREALYLEIRDKAVDYGVGESTPEEIDRLNILGATLLAMRRALSRLRRSPALVMVDGNRPVPGLEYPQRCLVGGDGLSASVAAASILAKVTRDRSMRQMHERYPEYGFARHKGYGTREHLKALKRLGPCPEHRRSFCWGLNAQTDLFRT